jgi:high-affinity iron transporter
MLINSVIIVLREVIEAALLISVLLAVSRRLQLSVRWAPVALIAGAVGAALYASLLDSVSELFDGVGQELINALMQVCISALLVVIVLLVARRRERLGGPSTALIGLMAISVALATIREGSEIIVYVIGFVTIESHRASVLLGSLTGAGIGFSVGVLLYYLLLAMRVSHALWVSLTLLALAASSMCAQAAKLLIQADWLPSGAPLWDTSALITEQSMVGQFLYALIGYEATPSAIEVVAYFGSIGIIIASALAGWFVFRTSAEETSG